MTRATRWIETVIPERDGGVTLSVMRAGAPPSELRLTVSPPGRVFALLGDTIDARLVRASVRLRREIEAQERREADARAAAERYAASRREP